jgi:hypothetical protein
VTVPFDWRAELAKRPHWMNALLLFCLYMTFLYLPYDLFLKPVNEDAEVWFGYLLHGWAAKATEPIHWAIYAAGAYGFWNMRPWMWPWASLYAFQVAVGMLVWGAVYAGGVGGWASGAVAFLFFAVLAVALWRARSRFSPSSA